MRKILSNIDSMFIYIFIVICFLTFTALMAGCTASATSQCSVCDNIESNESVLCDIAAKQGIPLESVGRGLIVVNAVAITGGLYTKDQAVTVLKVLRESLDNSVTYAVFAVFLEDYVKKYPEMMNVIQVYLDQFAVNRFINDVDKKILTDWLDERIKSLERI